MTVASPFLLLWASSAHANVSDVSLVAVWGEIAESCAIEVTVEDVEQDLINGAEELQVGGVSWGTFAQITPSIDGIRKGDSVLYASAAFEAETGAAADVQVDDQACATGIGPGTQIDFLGSFGPVAGTTTLPSDFGPDTAWNGTDIIDLTIEAILVHGLGGSWDVGFGESGGCGCVQGSSGWGAGGLASAALLGVAALRRRALRRS